MFKKIKKKKIFVILQKKYSTEKKIFSKKLCNFGIFFTLFIKTEFFVNYCFRDFNK